MSDKSELIARMNFKRSFHVYATTPDDVGKQVLFCSMCMLSGEVTPDPEQIIAFTEKHKSHGDKKIRIVIMELEKPIQGWMCNGA